MHNDSVLVPLVKIKAHDLTEIRGSKEHQVITRRERTRAIERTRHPATFAPPVENSDDAKPALSPIPVLEANLRERDLLISG